MASTAKRPIRLEIGDVRTLGFDLTTELEEGDLLTGTPTVVVESARGGNPVAAATGDLTIIGAVVNTAAFWNGDRVSVAIGKGVRVRISGQKRRGVYILKVSCGTVAGDTVVRGGTIIGGD